MVCIRITTLSIDLFVPLSSVTPSFFVFASVVPFYSLNLLEVHLSHHYLEKWPLLQSTHYFSDFSVKCWSPCVRLIRIPQGLLVALNELIYSAPIGLQVTSGVSFASKWIVHRNEHSVIIYSPSCCSNLYGWRIYIYIFYQGIYFRRYLWCVCPYSESYQCHHLLLLHMNILVNYSFRSVVLSEMLPIFQQNI